VPEIRLVAVVDEGRGAFGNKRADLNLIHMNDPGPHAQIEMARRCDKWALSNT